MHPTIHAGTPWYHTMIKRAFRTRNPTSKKWIWGHGKLRKASTVEINAIRVEPSILSNHLELEAHIHRLTEETQCTAPQ